MPRYKVTFNTNIGLTVVLDAEDDYAAGEAAWQPAEDYLKTVFGHDNGDTKIYADASLDGIGWDDVEEVPTAKAD